MECLNSQTIDLIYQHTVNQNLKTNPHSLSEIIFDNTGHFHAQQGTQEESCWSPSDCHDDHIYQKTYQRDSYHHTRFEYESPFFTNDMQIFNPKISEGVLEQSTITHHKAQARDCQKNSFYGDYTCYYLEYDLQSTSLQQLLTIEFELQDCQSPNLCTTSVHQYTKTNDDNWQCFAAQQNIN